MKIQVKNLMPLPPTSGTVTTGVFELNTARTYYVSGPVHMTCSTAMVMPGVRGWHPEYGQWVSDKLDPETYYWVCRNHSDERIATAGSVVQYERGSVRKPAAQPSCRLCRDLMCPVSKAAFLLPKQNEPARPIGGTPWWALARTH